MEIDIIIHEDIAGMIAHKYNDCINNIRLIWVYLVHEGKFVYLLKKSKIFVEKKIILLKSIIPNII